jgi:imidazole glycerol-phosphate synthase subunit HisH
VSVAGIVDCGAGNVASVHHALSAVAGRVVRVTAAADLDGCTHLVLPGVGAFGAAMERLRALDLIDALRERVLVRGVPLLGICVGMQILAEQGTEFGIHQGLGWVPGTVRRLAAGEAGLTLPHIGWSGLIGLRSSPLFRGIEEDATFYFVHSYCLEVPAGRLDTVQAEYGERFVAAFSRGNLHGVQFHPEKSQRDGLRCLRNFLDG